MVTPIRSDPSLIDRAETGRPQPPSSQARPNGIERVGRRKGHSRGRGSPGSFTIYPACQDDFERWCFWHELSGSRCPFGKWKHPKLVLRDAWGSTILFGLAAGIALVAALLFFIAALHACGASL